MTKTAAIILMMIMISITLHAQTWIPPEWEGINPPPRTHYVSAWAESSGYTVQEATADAERTAMARLKHQIYVRYQTIVEFEITINNSSISERGRIIDTATTRLFLQGVNKEIRRRIDGNNRVTALVFVYISVENVANAIRRARNETVAYSVYQFFRNNNTPGMRPFNVTPETWLYSRTGIIRGGGRNPSLYLNQIDALLRTLPITAFSANYDGKPARFVYDSSSLETIAAALQRQRVPFSLALPTLTIYGPIQRSNSVVLMGLERMHNRIDSQTVNTRGIFSTELTRLVQRHSPRIIEFFSLPPRASELSGAGTILEFAKSGNIPWSRFIIIFYVDSFIDPGMIQSGVGVPPLLFANAAVLVYDAALGEVIFTEIMRNGISIYGQQNLTASADMLLRGLLPADIPRAISLAIEARIADRFGL